MTTNSIPKVHFAFGWSIIIVSHFFTYTPREEFEMLPKKRKILSRMHRLHDENSRIDIQEMHSPLSLLQEATVEKKMVLPRIHDVIS